SPLFPYTTLFRSAVGLLGAFIVELLFGAQVFDARLQLLLLVLGNHVLLAILLPVLCGSGVVQPGAFQPAVLVILGQLAGLLQQADSATDPRRFLLHAMDGPQQVADALDGIAELAGFQYFTGDELIDRAHRLVGHEVGEGARRILRFTNRDRFTLAA